MVTQDIIGAAPNAQSSPDLDLPVAHIRLNMDGWDIDDFEVAMIGLNALNDAVVYLTNQPRANKDEDLRPGADFIAEIGEGLIYRLRDTVLGRLEQARFPMPDDEERRIKLWLCHNASFGCAAEPLDRLLAQVAAWRAEK